jgi:hypothetical protein
MSVRYFAGLLAVVAFIILVVVVVIKSVSHTTTPKNGAKTIVLTDYVDKNSEVRLYIDGRINSIEEHRAIEIVVAPEGRTLTVYKGYNLDVLKRKTYPEDQPAYDTFLYALALQGFVKERTNAKITDDTGVCPEGFRYIYKLRSDGDDVLRLWSSDCNSTPGTFAGKASEIKLLFQRQIPDYDRLISDVEL